MSYFLLYKMGGSEERRRNRRAFRKLFEHDEDSYITAKQIRELMPIEIMSGVRVNGMGEFLNSFLKGDIEYEKHCGVYILRGYKVREVESDESDSPKEQTMDNTEIESLRATLLETQNNLADMTMKESKAQDQWAEALAGAYRDREQIRVLTERVEALSREIASSQRVIIDSVKQAILEATGDIKKDFGSLRESVDGSLTKLSADNEMRHAKLVALQAEHLAKVVEPVKSVEKKKASSDESPKTTRKAHSRPTTSRTHKGDSDDD